MLCLPFHRAGLCTEWGQGLGTLEPGPCHPLGSVGAEHPGGRLDVRSRSVTSGQLSAGTFSDNLRRTLQRGFASREHGVKKGNHHHTGSSGPSSWVPHQLLPPAPPPWLAPPSGSLGVLHPLHGWLLPPGASGSPRRKEGYSLCSSRCPEVGRQVLKALLTRKESREKSFISESSFFLVHSLHHEHLKQEREQATLLSAVADSVVQTSPLLLNTQKDRSPQGFPKPVSLLRVWLILAATSLSS